MAKYTRYRNYNRRRHVRWSPNIQRINEEYELGYTSTNINNAITIAQNPVQSTSGVSQKFTVKNVEVSLQLSAFPVSGGNPILDGIEYYIMYIPQGYSIGPNLPLEHPEWILAYKYLGKGSNTFSPGSPNEQIPKIKTRLARKLNTGDSIVLMYHANQITALTSGNSWVIGAKGLVRWWSKAN